MGGRWLNGAELSDYSEDQPAMFPARVSFSTSGVPTSGPAGIASVYSHDSGTTTRSGSACSRWGTPGSLSQAASATVRPSVAALGPRSENRFHALRMTATLTLSVIRLIRFRTGQLPRNTVVAVGSKSRGSVNASASRRINTGPITPAARVLTLR